MSGSPKSVRQTIHKIVTYLLESWTWSRTATLGTVEIDPHSDAFRVSVVRRSARVGRTIRGAWARFHADDVRGLVEGELFELVSRRLKAALERIGVTPMKRKTAWIKNRWCVTAVYTP